ncbi:MAG: transcription antitermination factor NusB [Crocinitomicaceae bacterium]|nr:MAG: transcription antitermination factor NusB [Crocinitomicaceae bacterium]
MLNRRHLRIKVLQALYAYFQSEEDNYNRTEKELMHSIDKIYELYLFLLLSFEELKSVEETRLEELKSKIRPTESDLNPNRKFVQNSVFRLLEDNKSLRRTAEEHKINWLGDENQEMFKKMMAQIREDENYFSYMSLETTSFEEDLEYACLLFKNDIANSPLIYNFFEEKSIHWLDDIDLACSMVLKTIKSFSEAGPNEILPLYKEGDDEQEFVRILLRKTINNDKDNLELIDDLTKNWELDRIAKMDIILMKMAITELQEFSNIPKKVTLNEYIEISKFYSTPKSNGFINGILDKAIDRLEKDNKIVKIGRGLMD